MSESTDLPRATNENFTPGVTDAHGVQLLGVNLNARWSHATDDLRTLAHGLHDELGALLHGAALPMPVRKARLTRRGGRCEADGTPLTFEPWQPDRHACPKCHAIYQGVEHDDWWAMGAQLWCAERTLHAAILGSMRNDNTLLDVALRALNTFSEKWESYPNQDNVLGPSRLYFSTYLESVWLLNTTLAAHVLRSYSETPRAHRTGEANDSSSVSPSAASATVNRFISRVVEPCRALIASYPEGMSNRQTWHTAALLSCASLLRDHSALAPLVDGVAGVHTLIDRGILSDGTWYEGENYHLFAHRGLWYGVTLLESLGVALNQATTSQFAAGFRTPLLGVLPDGTFPSRRDSRYAVSVHQWRFAEWCELGLQRTDDRLLRTWLHRLYNAPLFRGDTGRARSTADIERDEPAQRLTRSDLGWRTLLFARNQPWPASESASEGSVILPAQGLHVLRRDADRIYVALEGGHTGGGHGHPDRLSLTIQDGSTRVLEDPGTGSYVDRSLHWYRSTLAHNAPLINGRSQNPVTAQLLAFEARSGVAWTRVGAAALAPGVSAIRTAVLLDEHVVDHFEWTSADHIMLDLPVHVDGQTADARHWTPGQPFAAGGLEDGVSFVRDAQWTPLHAGSFVELVPAQASGDRTSADVRCWYALSEGGELWRAVAPGPPGVGERTLFWFRSRGQKGAVLGVWSLRGSLARVSVPLNAGQLLPVQVSLRNGTEAVHAPSVQGWHIDLQAGDARSSIDLAGRCGELAAPPSPVATPTPERAQALRSASQGELAAPLREPQQRVDLLLKDRVSTRFVLEEQHYRRSEQSWVEAGRPTADVELTAVGKTLHIGITARTGTVVVPEPNAVNLLDNERADVNADGLQLYVAPIHDTDWTGAWLIVPHTQGARVTTLTSGSRDAPGGKGLEARSQQTPDGWRMDIALPLDQYGLDPDQPFRFDLMVNERPIERERRRGQLVLSGARGEFVYLRGDRHDHLRSWVVQCVPSHASRSLSTPPV